MTGRSLEENLGLLDATVIVVEYFHN